MLKLFLVEDEIIMRKGIAGINWQSIDIELVGEASDGELAYPMILETRPDILLTDIKMPFMDGLELSERVKKELPDIQIIILSGFGEFTYAQKAVSLGVTEYLLKPVTPDKLLETVGKIRQRIEDQRKKDDEFEFIDGIPEEKLEHKRQLFFRHLVMNTKSSAELLDLAKQVEVNLTARYFCVLLMSLCISGESSSDYSLTRNRLQEELEMLLAEQNGWTLFDRGENGFAMLVARNHQDTASKSIRQTLENICEAAGKIAGLEYFIAVGPLVNRVSEIKASYDQATRALSHRFLMDPDQVVYADRMPDHGTRKQKDSVNLKDAMSSQDAREVLDRFMRTGTMEEIGPLLDEVFERIGKQNLRSKIFMTYMLVDMYLTMLRFAKEMELEIDEDGSFGRQEEIQELLQQGVHTETAKEYIAERLKLILEKRDSKKEGSLGNSLAAAIRYLDENYAEEDLSLSDVASVANLSPNHFSAMFSKQVGMTFVEYLIDKRLTKAQELLMTTKMRSSEIAFMVGYKDPHYFSHTFKKNLGMTPKEYRQRGGRRES